MSQEPSPPSLDELDARLRKAKQARRSETPEQAPTANLGLALRVGVEMVAAAAVGGGLGWLLDQWLGTRPWLLVVFLVLGFAAGMLNAYRAAMRIAGPQDGGGE